MVTRGAASDLPDLNWKPGYLSFPLTKILALLVVFSLAAPLTKTARALSDNSAGRSRNRRIEIIVDGAC